MKPHKSVTPEPYMRLSGTRPLTLRPDSNFLMIGERTNVTGSRKFARLDQRREIRGGRRDRPLSRSMAAPTSSTSTWTRPCSTAKPSMTKFLRLIAGEHDVAAVPVMVDSSKWSVIEAGLKTLQGKAIVNSISLKDGEAEFLRRAKLCRWYGTAVVVMAFDEQGQAVDGRRQSPHLPAGLQAAHREKSASRPKTSSSTRTSSPSPPASRSTTTTRSISSSRSRGSKLLARAFTFPAASRTFRFRSAATTSSAKRSTRCFLYHAIQAGLDMGIVNAGQLAVYEDIEPKLKELVEDVILNRRPDATERLVNTPKPSKGRAAPPPKPTKPGAMSRSKSGSSTRS